MQGKTTVIYFRLITSDTTVHECPFDANSRESLVLAHQSITTRLPLLFLLSTPMLKQNTLLSILLFTLAQIIQALPHRLVPMRFQRLTENCDETAARIQKV